MLLASLAFYTILKGFRSFNAENLGSVGQRASKLPAVKVGGHNKKSANQPWPLSNQSARPDSGTPGVKSFSKFDGL